jgi:hypothetical protein
MPLLSYILKARRFTVVLMIIMFLGVDLTAFHAWPVIIQLILCVV